MGGGGKLRRGQSTQLFVRMRTILTLFTFLGGGDYGDRRGGGGGGGYNR